MNKAGNKKRNKSMTAVLIIIGVLISIAPVMLTGIFLAGSVTAKAEVYDDISHYREYMSFGPDSKWNKWGMDESIWPQQITGNMAVSDFKMVYYDPWDAQFLGYLVVDYSEDDCIAETERLRAYKSTNYIGNYGTEEEKTYDLLAINADPYNGFVYALTDGKNRIIYAEEIFCNYYMDLDYWNYIPEEYLLDGFDARRDNSYRKTIMHE